MTLDCVQKICECIVWQAGGRSPHGWSGCGCVPDSHITDHINMLATLNLISWFKILLILGLPPLLPSSDTLMASPQSLLLELISSQTNEVIKTLLMRHTSATSVSNKKKAEMSQLLLMHVLEDPEIRYPRVLADFTKRALDAVLPVKATRKADALDMIIRLDRRTFPKPADRDPSIAMQLVLVEPLITDVVLMLEVKAVKKRMKKKWARLARRRLKSQQMITALKQLISRPGADRMTVEQLRVEVCNEIGVVFDATRGTNMYVFFHKHVHRLLRKQGMHRKPARKRRANPLTFVADADAVKAWGETKMMWAEDHWRLKFSMLDTNKNKGQSTSSTAAPGMGSRG